MFEEYCPNCRVQLPAARGESCEACGADLVAALGRPIRERPTGLTVLATLQFLFGASIVYGFLRLADGAAGPQGFTFTSYSFISSAFTLFLLVTSAAGYLSQNRLFGYWGGNLLAVGSIANILCYSLLNDFAQLPLRLPGLAYPAVLLFLLNFRYRNAFH
ncbi:MAG: hypothetical protein U0835_17755 [Isosphaeraceae bacterium]